MAHDYIIVGAGSAGCVLANRLSENPDNSVLLLEAGGRDKKQEIHIPAAFSKLFKTEVDWAYFTEPQAHVDQRKLYWPRGKMLGGCSSINAMIYQRGHPNDYNHWAELGNEEWRYEEVLPYFKKSEHQERGASTYHGTGGPLNVADLRDVNPLSKVFVEAGVEAGLKRNHDFNGTEQEGVGIYQVTQKKGKRHSTVGAYLKPALKRPNLQAETFAQATKLPVERQDAIATWLLEEMAAEQRWEQAFANSHDLLAQLADEALAEHRAGETRFGTDKLSHGDASQSTDSAADANSENGFNGYWQANVV